MGNKKIFRRLRFTLVELIMAMAVFSILALIMMRFYSSAQQIWSKSSQRSEMYNDAHIALDLMARELQCVMYNNENTESGIYPFWFQKIRDVSSQMVGGDSPIIYYPTATQSNFEWTQLNFIAATNLKPKNAVSNICEIRYSFVPAGMAFDVASSIDGKIIGEGWLVRSCTGDDAGAKWNFTTPLPRLGGPAARIQDIWGDTSSALYQRVISGVYFMKFTCYYMDTAGVWQESVPIRYNTTTGVFSFGARRNSIDFYKDSGGVTGTVASGTPATIGLNGTPLPDAIRIDLFMMSPTDWREWKAKIDSGDIPGSDKIKLQRMRTFSKTVFINNKLSY